MTFCSLRGVARGIVRRAVTRTTGAEISIFFHRKDLRALLSRASSDSNLAIYRSIVSIKCNPCHYFPTYETPAATKYNGREAPFLFSFPPLLGFLENNGRQIRTQRGPLTPKPPSVSSEETRVCGFLKCTKVYWPVYNVLRCAQWLAPVGFSWI